LRWRIGAAAIIALLGAAVSPALFKAGAAEEKTDPSPPALRQLVPVITVPVTRAPEEPSSEAGTATATDSVLQPHVAARPPDDPKPDTATPNAATPDAAQNDTAPSGQAQGVRPAMPYKPDPSDKQAVDPPPRLNAGAGAVQAIVPERPIRIPLVNEPEPAHVTEPAPDARSTLDAEPNQDTDATSGNGAAAGTGTSSGIDSATATGADAGADTGTPHGLRPASEKSTTAVARPIRFGAGLPKLPAMDVAPVYFRGVQPGATTRGELVRQWGDATPGRRKDGLNEWLYTVPPYPKVTVTLTGQIVATITAKLKEPVESTVLIDRLKLQQLQGLPVLDDAGELLGNAFPEQGLMLSFAPGTHLVTQMLLETIDPEPFLARAVVQQQWHPQRSLRDLDYALKLDPKSARAHDLRAQILLDAGRLTDALQAADLAVHFDPQNSSYSLDRAEILGRLDRRGEAVQLTKDVVALADLPAVLKAHALCQLGDLTMAVAHEDKQALQFHLAAIKAAEPLIGDSHQAVRREAKRVLVDAHLGAANDIAWGLWQQKGRVVPKWLAQANELARDLIDNEQADPAIRLKVAREALSAAAGSRGAWDSSDWVQVARSTAATLLDATDDPLRQRTLEWELGVALANLLEFEPQRGVNERTLRDAVRALKLLESGAMYRQSSAEDGYLVGRLYFQVGVCYAVAKGDHATAVTWFEQASPWFNHPLPTAIAASPGRHGEMLVSMGISYWEIARREDGLRLTQLGTDLISQAVKARQLDPQSLTIPYGNLAAMHRALGHPEQAKEFAELALGHESKRR
jgi:tetratricopeptide (TPR) repeat protein